MKVSIIGTGYVGLVSGTCFAELGHDVTCIDIDEKKIETLKQGESPIYEPGLTDLLKKNIKNERLKFSTDYKSVPEAQAIFLAVGTPSDDDGRADLKYLKAAAEMTAQNISDDAIIVIKSTVPVGTNKMIEELVAKTTTKKFHIVNNPEFLKEGAAVEDFMKPDRVVIGFKEKFAGDTIEKLYEPLMIQGHPIYKMSNLSAEMTKYAANCFLATKISFINDIARLCDFTGADIDEVRKGITSDRRVGPHFLYPGLGYGGSCFPKDVKALINTARDYDMPLEIVEAAEKINSTQKDYFFNKVLNYFNKDLNGKTIALWGAAFKPKTDDIREAPAIHLVKKIIEAGGKVRIHDPIALENFINYMDLPKDQVTPVEDMYKTLDGANALVLVTEWTEFRAPRFKDIKEKLSHPVIFDGRNIYNQEEVRGLGFEYFSIGKNRA